MPMSSSQVPAGSGEEEVSGDLGIFIMGIFIMGIFITAGSAVKKKKKWPTQLAAGFPGGRGSPGDRSKPVLTGDGADPGGVLLLSGAGDHLCKPPPATEARGSKAPLELLCFGTTRQQPCKQPWVCFLPSVTQELVSSTLVLPDGMRNVVCKETSCSGSPGRLP